MMKQEIKVPSMGESITSGVIASWRAQEGESVNEGDILFELETDKATVEIPSPGRGTLSILVKEGAEVTIGQTVGQLTADEEAAQPAERKSQISPERPVPRQASAASGPQTAPAGPESAKPPAAAPPEPLEPPPVKGPPPAQPPSRRTEKVPMSTIRRKTAERLVKATQNCAYLTTFNEIDMEKVMAIRSQYQEKFQKEHGIKIGLMSFFIKACCQGLKEFPMVNTQVDGQAIVYQYFYDIGVAVSLEEGLLVPVIRDADTRHFAELEAAIADLARRARDKKLRPEELTGGTFTITNGGVFGSLLSTPIPAYPQTAILGMHAIKKRPVVAGEQIAIRPMMYVALTYDHRVIDGREAIGFLNRVKELIEEPDGLLLEL